MAYNNLKDLRRHLPTVPFLALTATATVSTRLAFQRQLGMKKPYVITRTPNRDNITLTVKRVSDMLCFDGLINALRIEQQHLCRRIIYCKTVNDCSLLFSYFEKQLGDKGYVGYHCSRNRLFAMYFHDTLEAKKEEILNDLLMSNGHFRVVIATNALGMGVNIPTLTYILHFGPPRQMEDYMQEIGRAGRSGQRSTAVLYYKPIHLLGCSADMKMFVKSSECRRLELEKHFNKNCISAVTHVQPSGVAATMRKL